MSKDQLTVPEFDNVIFDPGVADDWKYWATASGLSPHKLRILSNETIRTSHHHSSIEGEWHKANGRQPDIYSLELASPRPVTMHYTIESHATVVRGYSWEPLVDDDGGMIFYDAKWSLTVDS